MNAILSIDTYKSEVAEAAVQAGAGWINDVWGLRADPLLAEVAARHTTPVILMHNRSKPSNAELQEKLGGRYIGMEYNDLIVDVTLELLASVDVAMKAGVSQDHIILDPGIGFGKTVEQNLLLLNRWTPSRRSLPGAPRPVGKSFIGYTLISPRISLEGTLAACAVGIQRGVISARARCRTWCGWPA